MEASCSSSGRDNGNGNDSPSETTWVNLEYFIIELARITGTEITGNDIFSHSVGDKILKALRQRQNELIRLEGFMKNLCDITNVSIEGEDICSQSFVNSLLDYMRQDIVLMEGIRTNFAERRPFQSGTKRVVENCDTQPTLATYHSNDPIFPTKSSVIAPNENNEVPERHAALEDVKVFPVASQIIPIGTPSIPIPALPLPEGVSTSHELQQHPISPTLYLDITTDNHANWPSPPILSPNLPEEGHQSASQAREYFGQLQSTNENQVGTGSAVVINKMLNEVNQTPIPSTSRQLESTNLQTTSNMPGSSADVTKKIKRLTERILRKKIHASSGFHEGSYWCTCLGKFKTKAILRNHIKRFNSLWKFKCDKCQKKCYDLTKLKWHLKKEHDIENPLKDFAIGCTICGIMFKTRMEYNVHKRTQHNIYNVPKPRQPCGKPRQSELPPVNPTESSPRVVKIEVVDIEDDENTQEVPRLRNQNEVIDPVRDDEGDNVNESVYFPSIIQGNLKPLPPPTQ